VTCVCVCVCVCVRVSVCESTWGPIDPSRPSQLGRLKLGEPGGLIDFGLLRDEINLVIVCNFFLKKAFVRTPIRLHYITSLLRFG